MCSTICFNQTRKNQSYTNFQGIVAIKMLVRGNCYWLGKGAQLHLLLFVSCLDHTCNSSHLLVFLINFCFAYQKKKNWRDCHKNAIWGVIIKAKNRTVSATSDFTYNTTTSILTAFFKISQKIANTIWYKFCLQPSTES